MKKKHIVLALAGVGILVAILVAAWPRPEPEVLYEVVFLPTLGGSYAGPRAINDRGQVVGIANVWRTPWQDLLWPEITPIRQLPQVPAQNLWHVMLWEKDGGMKDLGPAADLTRFEYMLINNAGQIAATGADPNGAARAFLQDPNGTRYSLRAANDEQVYIRWLNNRGQIVGYHQSERSPRRAFLWDKTRGMQSLAPSGTIESLATGINDAGQVVGFVSLQRSNQWHAFLWDPNTGLRDLGLAEFGPTQTCHINNQGLVVGQFGAAEDRTCVSTWTVGGGARRLDSRGASVHVAGLSETGRFVARAYWSGIKVLGHDSPGKSSSYLGDPKEGFQTMERHLGRRGVLEFIAMDMNNEGRIVGLLRLKGQPDPCAVILEPLQ